LLAIGLKYYKGESFMLTKLMSYCAGQFCDKDCRLFSVVDNQCTLSIEPCGWNIDNINSILEGELPPNAKEPSNSTPSVEQQLKGKIIAVDCLGQTVELKFFDKDISKLNIGDTVAITMSI
jgi:hypothetical protein